MTPGPLLNRPKLQVQDHEYLTFYETLAEARSMGMSSPNPLAIAEVAGLCSLMGIASPGDKSKYLRITQQLDRVYREHWHDNQPKQ